MKDSFMNISSIDNSLRYSEALEFKIKFKQANDLRPNLACTRIAQRLIQGQERYLDKVGRRQWYI